MVREAIALSVGDYTSHPAHERSVLIVCGTAYFMPQARAVLGVVEPRYDLIIAKYYATDNINILYCFVICVATKLTLNGIFLDTSSCKQIIIYIFYFFLFKAKRMNHVTCVKAPVYYFS